MLCQKCKKARGEIKLPYLGLMLCKGCFCKLIERRVKKEIRSKNLINLKYLNLHGNEIKTIIGLENLTDLRYLILNKNHIGFLQTPLYLKISGRIP